MFKLEKTTNTPEISVSASEFTMKGICTPENPPKFFDQFKEAFEHLVSGNQSSELVFHLDYFNTGSSKCLYNLFKDVSQKAAAGKVKITWIYEEGDDEMKESGELYSEISGIEFNYIEKNNN